MKEFTIEHTPAQIVSIFPEANDLFKVKQIDYCCGGDKPLANVFAENKALEKIKCLKN